MKKNYEIKNLCEDIALRQAWDCRSGMPQAGNPVKRDSFLNFPGKGEER